LYLLPFSFPPHTTCFLLFLSISYSVPVLSPYPIWVFSDVKIHPTAKYDYF
jgi:hypothetical protein